MSLLESQASPTVSLDAPPAHPPLLHLDVLQIVLQHAEPSTLAACARVCREFHESCTRLLWQGSDHESDAKWRTPSISVLADLAERCPERLSRCLEHVDALYLRADADDSAVDPSRRRTIDGLRQHGRESMDAVHSLLDSDVLSSAKIKASILFISILKSNFWSQQLSGEELTEELTEVENALAVPCLNSRLVELSIGQQYKFQSPRPLQSGLVPCKNLTNVIISDCPRLEVLQYNGHGSGASPDALMRLLSSLPNMRLLSLPCFRGQDLETMRRVNSTIMHHPKLEQIDMHLQPLGPRDLDEALSAEHRWKFPNMRAMRLNDAHSALVPKFTPHLALLQTLHIDVSDQCNDAQAEVMVCQAVSPLDKLVEFTVMFRHAVPRLTGKTFLCLANSCPLLRKLDMGGRTPMRTTITESEIVYFVSRMTHLQWLEMFTDYNVVDCPFLTASGEAALANATDVDMLPTPLEKSFGALLDAALPNLWHFKIFGHRDPEAFLGECRRCVNLKPLQDALHSHVRSRQEVIGPCSEKVWDTITKDRRRRRRIRQTINDESAQID